jgi:hypothetical protein
MGISALAGPQMDPGFRRDDKFGVKTESRHAPAQTPSPK